VVATGRVGVLRVVLLRTTQPIFQKKKKKKKTHVRVGHKNTHNTHTDTCDNYSHGRSTSLNWVSQFEI
jgi:hypothetical protein